MKNEKIRNIAIIAHVDHGKTTLVDGLLKAGGIYRANQQVEERAMDSMDLEREKGITIKAKNTSIHWKDYTINIVDTPGHADFGGEVERALKMVDGVLLLIDAYDGPQAQTRFVLRKALQAGLKPIVVINKIDRPNADPEGSYNKVLELLMDLEANEEQFNCPFVYASGRDGYAIRKLSDEKKDLTPLFEMIIQHIPAPEADMNAPFKMLVSNVGWDDYVGRIAIGKIAAGKIAVSDNVWLKGRDGKHVRGKVTKIFEYTGLATHESAGGVAGNIVGVSGFEDVDIGETVMSEEEGEALPFIEIDPPTIEMFIRVNDGPLAGREGKYVTSRQIRERLYRELKTNISIKVEDTEESGAFRVKARGTMQIAVLVETMRREGFELTVSRPEVIYREENGQKTEPYELLWVETPEDCMGPVMQELANRKGRITNMHAHGSMTTIEAKITTRGLIGFGSFLTNQTSGRGIASHLYDGYGPFAGELLTRITGTLVSTATGEANFYSIQTLQDRGRMFIKHADTVYEGMIVGENPRRKDMPVNPTKMKKLTNVRSQGEGVSISIAPPEEFSLEKALEYIQADEYVEVTPKSLRMRKQILNQDERRRWHKAQAMAAGTWKEGDEDEEESED
jgi:GTP-binding protein